MNDFEYFDFDNLPQSFRFYGGSDKKDSVNIAKIFVSINVYYSSFNGR